MGKNNLYENATTSIALYSNSSTSSEVNMRQEFIDMFDGKTPQIAKSHPALLRRMRRDDDNKKIVCGCVDTITKEPDKDRFCPICYGEGFLWDEEELQVYKVLEDSDFNNTTRNELRKPGLINIGLIVFYIRYDSEITKDDKIIQLVLSVTGSTVTPRTRQCVNRIETIWDYRSDNGKLEYWKVFAHKEDVKYLNAPSYEDV